MLCLDRKTGENVVIGDTGDTQVVVRVISVTGSHVVLGFDAPRTIPIDRAEVRLRKDLERATLMAARAAGVAGGDL